MTDADVATRAPESDFESEGPTMDTVPLTSSTDESSSSAPPQPSPSTSTPSTQPTISSHCTTDRPLPSSSSSPTGDLDPINGIPCYISKPPSYPSNPSKLLLLLPSGTSLLSTNNQLQADAWAALGYVVVMPDQFSGDPAPSAANTASAPPATTAGLIGAEAGAQPDQHAPSIIERIKLGVAETAKSFVIDMWLARHTPATVMPILQKVLAGCHEQFADAIANGGGIYGVGYCFGAKYVLLLCGEQTDSVVQGRRGTEDAQELGEVKHQPALKAGAVAHGTLVTREDLETVRSPVALVCCRDDPVFPEEVVVAGRESFQRNGVSWRVQWYESPHGFAVVGDYGDEKIKADQEDAFGIMSEWLKQERE